MGGVCFDLAARASVHGWPTGRPTYVTNTIELVTFSAASTLLMLIGACHFKIEKRTDNIPFSAPLFGGHILCVAGYCLGAYMQTSLVLLHSPVLAFRILLQMVFLAAVVLLALACIPFRIWIATLHEAGPLWLYLIPAVAVALVLNGPVKGMWNASTDSHLHFMQVITLKSVGFILRLFVHNVVVDSSALTIGISQFSIYIAAACSGMEGIGLIFVFELVWLAFFRNETRFPQALVLIPASLVCIWLLNVIRLAALILIGYKLSPEVALIGFHSQAGWIAFMIVAVGFVIVWQNLDWARRPGSTQLDLVSSPALSVTGPHTKESLNRTTIAQESPATAAFLVPFLAILAASFVSKAASGYFEWLYPLRFVVAAIALWHFRSEFKKLDWRIGWIAPLTGTVVFIVWIGPALWTHRYAASPLGPALAALSPAMRFLWIACRVLAAVITVPLAEELAFRGYLARRLVSRGFDGVSFRRLTILSIAVSSVAFGLMHGPQWPVGILAGVAFALVLRWRGRFGDAVAAHAVSNLMLAVWVLARGDWAQW